MIIIRKPGSGISQLALTRFATRAHKAVKLTGTVDVLITGSSEMQRFNREFRKKDKPTDVLSFPSELPGVAGDIAISADIALKYGRKFGHGQLTELKILILHGMLHLSGMDHETDDGQMARRERRLRRELGLPEGLIERTDEGKRTRGVSQ